MSFFSTNAQKAKVVIVAFKGGKEKEENFGLHLEIWHWEYLERVSTGKGVEGKLRKKGGNEKKKKVGWIWSPNG
jgi:hypothetical protein